MPDVPDWVEFGAYVLACCLVGVTMYVLGRRRFERVWRRARSGLRRRFPKIGRNQPCICGSGRKWKRCCGVRTPRRHGGTEKGKKEGEAGDA